MLSLVSTPRIQQLLKAAAAETTCPKTLAQDIAPFMERTLQQSADGGADTETPTAAAAAAAEREEMAVPVDLIIACWQHVRKHQETLYLHEVVHSSKFHLPPPAKREKSPELIALLEKTRLEQQHKEYNRLVANVMPESQREALGLSYADRRAITRTYYTFGNVMFTVVSVFVAVWYLAGAVSDSVAIKTLVSFLAALLVAIAEGYLIWATVLRDEANTNKHLLDQTKQRLTKKLE
ncbi:hypothetical protein RI367_000599 [Sorochytrium milnesiophthora]